MIQNTKENLDTSLSVLASPLGKSSAYITQYTADLLFPIPRKGKRDEINVPDMLPFSGFDTWNAYEVSWLNSKGKPIVVVIQFDFSCNSKNIIESKSFKLYLNSFNNTKFSSIQEVHSILETDLRSAAEGEVNVTILKPLDMNGLQIKSFDGECLDDSDIECDSYIINTSYLVSNPKEIIAETLTSDLLKSNCLVTGQPDWGSVKIEYKGPRIDKDGLLKYIVSFRNHNEFHEQCVERIFMDISKFCNPESLTIEARYTRRGGLDINPIRSTEEIAPSINLRMARQ